MYLILFSFKYLVLIDKDNKKQKRFSAVFQYYYTYTVLCLDRSSNTSNTFAV